MSKNSEAKKALDTHERLKVKVKNDPSLLTDPTFRDQLDTARANAQKVYNV